MPELTRDFAGRQVTTTAVLTELADGFARSGDRNAIVRFISDLRGDLDIDIVTADEALFEAGMQLYASRPDKDWSLTDCMSFVVMQQQGILEALTGDRHFEQAGFIALLK